MPYTYIKAKPISYGDTRTLSSVKYIVIHYTGNKGDTAKNNVDYFHNGNKTEAGAHFFVDQQGKVYQSIAMNLTAWAVGGFFTDKKGAAKYYKKCTNANSVSIEMCDCATKDPSDKMIKAMKELVAHIQKNCPDAKTIIRHWDVNGKDCPARMTGTDNAKWKALVKAITPTAKKQTTPTKLTVPTATLQKGATGTKVKNLQKCLNYHMNAGLDVDGSFGPATEKALKAFQKKYKLTVDGSYGPKTHAKMKEVIK